MGCSSHGFEFRVAHGLSPRGRRSFEGRLPFHDAINQLVNEAQLDGWRILHLSRHGCQDKLRLDDETQVLQNTRRI